MARGGRNTETEENRMKSMEQGPTLKEGQRDSGPRSHEKEGFYGGRNKKTPKTAARP